MLAELKKNPKNIRFGGLCTIVESFGFRLRGIKGSHRVYAKEGVAELLNFENVRSKAKPYQVRQFIRIVEKYGLLKEDE